MFKLYNFKVDKYNFRLVKEDDDIIYLNTDYHNINDEFKEELIISNNEEIKEIINQLDLYFKGELKEFTFKFKLKGTKFQIDVWHQLLKIKYGGTLSYSDIANNLGKPNSSRAVGNAVGKNPMLIVVPCHRIIRKNNSLGGFSSDINVKIHLLELENKNK